MKKGGATLLWAGEKICVFGTGLDILWESEIDHSLALNKWCLSCFGITLRWLERAIRFVLSRLPRGKKSDGEERELKQREEKRKREQPLLLPPVVCYYLLSQWVIALCSLHLWSSHVEEKSHSTVFVFLPLQNNKKLWSSFFSPPSLVREDRKTTSSLFRDLLQGTLRYNQTKTQTWRLFVLKTQRVLCDR